MYTSVCISCFLYAIIWNTRQTSTSSRRVKLYVLSFRHRLDISPKSYSHFMSFVFQTKFNLRTNFIMICVKQVGTCLLHTMYSSLRMHGSDSCFSCHYSSFSCCCCSHCCKPQLENIYISCPQVVRNCRNMGHKNLYSTAVQRTTFLKIMCVCVLKYGCGISSYLCVYD